MLINKTANKLATPIAIAGQTGTANASFYSYSGADLTAIHRLANVSFNAGAARLWVPAMSMNMLVVPLD